MASKSLVQFPIFSPPSRQQQHHRPATEIRFSRWNNANAEKFIRREQTQKQLEDQIRFEKRFSTAERISHNYNPAPPQTTFKSTGTPSSPSKPSIPGKFSKYSKKFTESNSKRLGLSHPAFRPIIRHRKLPSEAQNGVQEDQLQEARGCGADVSVKVEEKGVVYEVPDAPFVYQYSYTETPKMKPLRIREPLVSPFGPDTMNRPWTGRKPLPPSKKNMPEFDSFQLPPANKKGVKPIQAPGPFLEGTGPRYVKTREEVLGEPLSKEEVEELIKSCQKTQRQLNIGRDGLTHNMLDNIHAHWKRRRVCKIKCKGVCTVDMDNVRQQLEEKTGGKIIFSKGGVIYLFRGRNYNFKTRPRFPLMLWRPVTPVYPRLIKRVPEGLTLEEASDLRKKGRNLIPICKLGKNGVYCDLAKNVREAFEACELVRINCQGMNGSDYRKIGAKLKDLVPCVLISFENEHILMWRGRDWKLSLPELKDDVKAASKSKSEDLALKLQAAEGDAGSMLATPTTDSDGILDNKISKTEEAEESKELNIDERENPASILSSEASIASSGSKQPRDLLDGSDVNNYELVVSSVGSIATAGEAQSVSSMLPPKGDKQLDTSDSSTHNTNLVTKRMSCTEGVLKLWKQAIETGSAVILPESDLNADIVYRRSVNLTRSAPPGPVFKHLPRRVKVASSSEQQTSDSEQKEGITVSGKDISASGKKGGESKTPRNKNMDNIKEGYLNVAPRGSLGIDELAKLLA